MNILWLAWRYILYNRWKTVIMVACITLTLVLPAAITILISQFNRQIVARAESTPFVIGTKGSRLDLALHAIYFQGEAPKSIAYSNIAVASQDNLAEAIPIYSESYARNHPVVGTTLDYFEFRKLEVEQGEMMYRIGQCVIGYSASKKLSLRPGDHVLTQSENVIDIAGAYPLNLLVSGVLAKTDSPDDEAIFVDIKTAWVIAGLGHGHDDIELISPDKIIGVTGNKTVASPAVQPYLEFTDETANNVHFHGAIADFPLTAIITLPPDDEAGTRLLFRINRDESPIQMVEPIEEVQHLMEIVFQIKRLFNANAVLLAISTLLLITLVVMLSLRLRNNEMQTMFKLGCGKGTVVLMQVAELFLICIMSSILVALLILIIMFFAPDLIRWVSTAT